MLNNTTLSIGSGTSTDKKTTTSKTMTNKHRSCVSLHDAKKRKLGTLSKVNLGTETDSDETSSEEDNINEGT